jgi:hypothetical protein
MFYNVSMTPTSHDHLIQQVCQQVLSLSVEQSLPDDDCLHCAAAAHALNILGVPSEFFVSTIHYSNGSLDHVQMAYLSSNDQIQDMQGNKEVRDNDLEKLRTNYLVNRYGMHKTKVDYASTDVLGADMISARWGDFTAQYEHLAAQAVARVQGGPVPSPLPADPQGATRSGPLARPRYATKLQQLLESANAIGLGKLLEEWKQDPDLDRPANLPQQMAYALASSSGPGYGFASGEIVSLVMKTRQYGANIHQLSARGDNLLHAAVYSGHEELVGYLLQEGVAIDLPTHPRGCTSPPLFHAIINDRLNIARLLIDNGANINLAGCDGDTPLCAAARRGLDELMNEFIANGADIHVCNRMSENLLHMVCETHFKNASRKMEVVTKLLDLGVCANKLSARGALPHHCLPGNEERIKAQLQYEWANKKLAQTTPPASSSSPRRAL